MYTITLFQDQTGWYTRHTDPRVRELFGSDVLPCGFGRATPTAVAVAKIRQLNPDREVRLGACCVEV